MCVCGRGPRVKMQVINTADEDLSLSSRMSLSHVWHCLGHVITHTHARTHARTHTHTHTHTPCFHMDTAYRKCDSASMTGIQSTKKLQLTHTHTHTTYTDLRRPVISVILSVRMERVRERERERGWADDGENKELKRRERRERAALMEKELGRRNEKMCKG